MVGLLADVAHRLVGALLGNVSLLEAVVACAWVLAVLHQVTGLAAVVAHSLVGAGGGLLWWCDGVSWIQRNAAIIITKKLKGSTNVVGVNNRGKTRILT